MNGSQPTTEVVRLICVCKVRCRLYRMFKKWMTEKGVCGGGVS